MSFRSYDFSTFKLTGSSGGASLIDFTQPWGLKTFHLGTIPNSTTAAATWTAGSSIGDLQHHVAMTFTGADVTEKDLQEFVARAICHAFIDTLPLNALEEIAECIVDNYNRHVVRPWRMAALPSAPSQRLQGKLGAAKPRPAFHLLDE